MSTLSPPPASPSRPELTPEERAQADKYRTLTRNCSLTLIFLCPVILALPPRKLNFGSVGLVGVWGFSGDHLTKHYTGRGIVERVFKPSGASSSSSSSSSASGGSTGGGGGGEGSGGQAPPTADYGSFPTEKARLVHLELKRRKEELAKARGEDVAPPSTEPNGGVLSKIWMGSEQANWKETRLREEQEKLNAGIGYGTMIKDYFRDAFGVSK